MKNPIESEILHIILGGSRLDKLQIPRTDGRLDLRYLDFSKEKQFGKLVVAKLRFEGCDFSQSNFSGTVWELCDFKNTRFESLQAAETKFRGCTFKDSVFIGADLRDAALNTRKNEVAGQFTNVDFIKCDLRGSMHDNALYEKCRFMDCKLKGVFFGGSRFVECKFSGKVEEVIFNRNEPLSPRFKLDTITKPNEMTNVDFTDAKLESVIFGDDLDLSTCLFPSSDDYLIIRKNRLLIFELARETIEKTWTHEPDKKMALAVVDRYYLKESRKKQQMEVLEKDWFDDFDKEFGKRFFDLLNELNQKYGI